MKTLIFLSAFLLTGCAQYSDDDLDTRPVTNNVYRDRSPNKGTSV